MKSQLASSNCLKPCAGLTVTGYSKFHGNKNLEDHFPIFAAYNMYKRITDNPIEFKGTNYVHAMNKFQFVTFMIYRL